MAKVRVYEIAKEVGIESKALVARLQTMGYDVRSHASALEDFEAREAMEKIKSDQKANIVQHRISGRVIRRRARELTPEEAAAAELALEQGKVEQPVETPEVAAPMDSESQAAVVIHREKPAEPTEPGEIGEAEAEPAAAVQPQHAPESATTEARSQEAAVSPPPATTSGEESSTMFRAQLVRRPAPPVPGTGFQAQVISRPSPDAARPSGIRVLKVVPGKEGRGHEFIDMSKPEKGRKKPVAIRSLRADLREQLFDVYAQDYIPGGPRRRRMGKPKPGRKTAITTPRAQKRVIKLEACNISIAELAKRMGIKQAEVTRKYRELGGEIEESSEGGHVVDGAHVLDLETATMLAQEFEHEIQDDSFNEQAIIKACQEAASPEGPVTRPPVVTVMGHVDHGKTSLLDAIRKTNVADGEEGGITQHIGAYEVILPKGSITFIDTPGHEAFTAMRARGASITDLVVLVVAADDGIMPQTIEAIHHAQEAKVPIVVAINKIDLPGAQPDKIRQALTEYNLVAEAWGGETIIVEVSAKTKVNVNTLLDNLLLQAEMLDLKASPQNASSGNVVEARLDRGRGPVATLLIRDGTLSKGDFVIAGTTFGRVRSMFDALGKEQSDVGPGRPVQVQGLEDVPMAGEPFHVVKNEREAKRIIDHRRDDQQNARSGTSARLSLEDFYERLQGAEKPELKILVKADVQGSAEAVRDALEKLSTPKVTIKVIHFGVGAITETDVNLASASKAILVGFNVRPDANAKKLAQGLNIDIRVYKIIYDLTEDIRKAQVGLLPTTSKENVLGRAEVRDLFNVPKLGTVAGVSVIDGKMIRGSLVRLLRDSVEVHQGKMTSLKRFKEDVREVAQGFECGIGIENFNDIKRGDIIEAYVIEQEHATL